MKVAVVGATGLVGTRMMEVLAERHFPVTEFLPVASERSAGRKVVFNGKEYIVIGAQEAIAAKPDLHDSDDPSPRASPQTLQNYEDSGLYLPVSHRSRQQERSPDDGRKRG